MRFPIKMAYEKENSKKAQPPRFPAQKTGLGGPIGLGPTQDPFWGLKFKIHYNKVIDTRTQVQGVWCAREQPPSISQRFICLQQNWLLRSVLSEPSAQISIPITASSSFGLRPKSKWPTLIAGNLTCTLWMPLEIGSKLFPHNLNSMLIAYTYDGQKSMRAPNH